MPADVYLVNDVNAFVTERGGVMGLGSRRVMGIGLPLLQSLTVQEFKAVLAHEFGHYHAGDVKIGPWIYKTRAAMGRTIAKPRLLPSRRSSSPTGMFSCESPMPSRGARSSSPTRSPAMPPAPRRWRRRCARFMGPRSRSTATGAAKSARVLNSGFLPPLFAGFAKFVQAESVSAMAESIRAEEATGDSDASSTHPPLRERVAALHPFPPGGARHASRRYVSR